MCIQESYVRSCDTEVTLSLTVALKWRAVKTMVCVWYDSDSDGSTVEDLWFRPC